MGAALDELALCIMCARKPRYPKSGEPGGDSKGNVTNCPRSPTQQLWGGEACMHLRLTGTNAGAHSPCACLREEAAMHAQLKVVRRPTLHAPSPSTGYQVIKKIAIVIAVSQQESLDAQGTLRIRLSGEDAELLLRHTQSKHNHTDKPGSHNSNSRQGRKLHSPPPKKEKGLRQPTGRVQGCVVPRQSSRRPADRSPAI
eukprot:1159955-Pelagomonas_calceolata.AAC.10